MKFIEKLKNLFTKKAKPKEEEEERKSWRKLLQQLLANLMRKLKRQQKLDDISTTNLQATDEEIATIETISLGKNLDKRKKKSKEQQKKLKLKAGEKKRNLLEILNDYQKLLEEDFTIILKKADELLQNLKNSVNELISKKNATASDISDLSEGLVEISSIYILADSMMTTLLDNCRDYRLSIIDAKRFSSSEQKLNTAQTQLDKVMKQLQKGQKMAEIQSNKDYKYVSCFLEKNKSISLAK